MSVDTLEVLLAAGARTSIEMVVQHCGDRSDEAYRTSEKVAARHGARLVTAEVLPFGRGRRIAIRRGVQVDTVPDAPCGVAVRPVLQPDGELYTCCGPARGAQRHSPLRLGIGTTGDVGKALSTAATNPILNVIHSKGPRALLGYLSPAVRERVSTRLLNGSICALCRSITDDSEAVAELDVALQPDRYRLLALSAVMRTAQDELAARPA